MTSSTTRIEDHLPDAYLVASEASAKGQKWFKWLTRVSLLLLVVAAIGGLIEHTWGGWVSAGAFLISIVLTALAIYRKTEQEWYDGRAAAESVKSVIFKYAVGGEPFGVKDEGADDRLSEVLGALIVELKTLNTEVPAPRDAPVFDTLRELRAKGLPERRSAYQAQRIEDQRAWYANRASEHRSTAKKWRFVMFGSQAAGVVGAILKGLGMIEIDLMALFATIAAATAAWIAAGDLTETARAYDFASLELEQAMAKSETVDKEEDWAPFVADSEQAMSREHTMWLARRRSPKR